MMRNVDQEYAAVRARLAELVREAARVHRAELAQRSSPRLPRSQRAIGGLLTRCGLLLIKVGQALIELAARRFLPLDAAQRR